MMRDLQRRLAYWLLDEPTTVEIGRNGRHLESNCMRIDIYRGDGGLAVETTVYNSKRDENHIGFYIVHDDENLGQQLSKIITAESIKAS